MNVLLNQTFCKDERKMWCKLSLEFALARSLQIESRAGRRKCFGIDCKKLAWEETMCPQVGRDEAVLNFFTVELWSCIMELLTASSHRCIFFNFFFSVQTDTGWWSIIWTIFNTNHRSINNWIKSAEVFWNAPANKPTMFFSLFWIHSRKAKFCGGEKSGGDSGFGCLKWAWLACGLEEPTRWQTMWKYCASNTNKAHNTLLPVWH